MLSSIPLKRSSEPLPAKSRRCQCAATDRDVDLAVRPDRNTRKRSERLGQRAIFVSWLIKQAATIERVSHRTKRWRNLRARLIEASR
jgi:hypothetical protein